MKVFIVDDSSIVRERLVALLCDVGGIEITGHAENAAEAIQSIKVLRPDAVILDLKKSTTSSGCWKSSGLCLERS